MNAKLSDAVERTAKEERRSERALILVYMREGIVLGEEAQRIANVIAEEIEELNHYDKGARSAPSDSPMPPEHYDHDVAVLDRGGYCEDCRVELPKVDVELIRAWEYAEAWKRVGVR